MVRTPNFHDKGPGGSIPGGKLRSDKPHSMFPTKKKKTQPKTPKPSETHPPKMVTASMKGQKSELLYFCKPHHPFLVGS